MLRYDKTEPGLVALYNIWPGNGTGLFLQPRSLPRATVPGTGALKAPPRWMHSSRQPYEARNAGI